MGDKSKIEWTDATWNPIRGCTRVSEGCRHCYAEGVAGRFAGKGLPYEGLATMRNGEARWTGEVRVIEHHMRDPLRWERPRRIFVNSMSDLFHEKLDDATIDRVFAVMALAPRHKFQILTKRPERMRAYVRGERGGRDFFGDLNDAAREISGKDHIAIVPTQSHGMVPMRWPLPNVWLGVSAEHQAAANERVPLLLDTPAAVRFVSAEPLLGPIDFTRIDVGDAVYHPLAGSIAVEGRGHAKGDRLDWIIVGGESGAESRTMDVEWAEDIAVQCRKAGVAVFVKQDSGPYAGKQGRLSDAMWHTKEFPQCA